MHFYQHNIKSFNNATRHLTRVERALYRDLIELYYDTEEPLPATNFDRLARKVLAVSDEDKVLVQYILDEFFELTGEVWTHSKCDKEIDKYRNTHSAKARAGKASADARKAKADQNKQDRSKPKATLVEQMLNTCLTNQEPRTKNQEPITNNQDKTIAHSSEHADEFSFDDFWNAYPRKTGKAQAQKSWNKLKLSDDLISQVLKNLRDRVTFGEWRLEQKDFIPHPATYLNNNRWEDELITSGKAGVKQNRDLGIASWLGDDTENGDFFEGEVING